MRRASPQRRKRNDVANRWRAEFRLRVGKCEHCGKAGGGAVHEIARGPARHLAMDKASCVLLLCDPGCHQIVGAWPEAAADMKENGWRFFEHDKGSDWIPGDRFPLADWMKERFGLAA